MRRNEKTLTRLEFEVMSILWNLGRPACAWDVLGEWPEPRPAYTTVATYLKVLYEKGYLGQRKNLVGGQSQ
ncbi:MAG: BlaI/MecI/CopY family transcriptional regulator [Bacteroidaceae bacterium]|nr:BlaI/MecI/CopY family transcriptional regulator [Bacteroidaceae bacterium]